MIQAKLRSLNLPSFVVLPHLSYFRMFPHPVTTSSKSENSIESQLQS